MLDHYIDITLHPGVDLAPGRALGDVLSALHCEFVRRSSDGERPAIGMSLPGHHGRESGRTLRLHGDANTLASLDTLEGLSPLYRLSGLHPVPAGARYRSVRRRQTHSSPARLARRYARRHGVSLAQAGDVYREVSPARLDLPALMVQSRSTRRLFPLLLEHGPLQDAARTGDFDSYGLGAASDATVPWF